MENHSNETQEMNSFKGQDGRRKPPSQKKTWQVTKMWEQHHEIVRLRTTGMQGAEIARSLGVSEAMVSLVLNSPIVQDKLLIMRGARDADSVDVAKRIKDLAPKALDVLAEVIEGTMDVSPTLKITTARDLLSRAGHPPLKQIQGVYTFLTPSEIEDLKKRAKTNGKATGTVIEMEEANV
jgi:predicted transcriptional regulator